MESAARLLALLACVGWLAGTGVSASSAKLTILDGDGPTGSGPLAIESIAADYVCSGQASDSVQLRKFATIGQLADYFERAGGSQLDRCIEHHSQCLRLLNGVVSESNDNVCSDAKVSLIEEFHAKCVTRSLTHHRAPHILRLFFQHYAIGVSRICRQTLLGGIDASLEHMVDEDSRMNEMLARLSGYQKLSDYNDVILFWNFIRKLSPSNRCFRKHSDRHVRMLFKVNEAESMRSLQRNCLLKYRPVYRQLVLPIVRLSALGYSPRERLDASSIVPRADALRKWYSVTQLCEAILPIEFYTDPRVKASRMVAINREEAIDLVTRYHQAAYGAIFEEAVPPHLIVNNQLTASELWADVDFQESQTLVKRAKSSGKGLLATLRRLLSKLAKKLPRMLAGRELFASVKQANGSVKEENLAGVLSKPVEELDDSDLDKLSASLEDGSESDGSALPAASQSRADQEELLHSLASEPNPAELVLASGSSSYGDGSSCLGSLKDTYWRAKAGFRRWLDRRIYSDDLPLLVVYSWLALMFLIIVVVSAMVIG